MSDKLSASDNPANKEHLCAKQVVHEKFGKGDCIPTMHADPDEAGHVAWYDVMFEHGIECRVPVDSLNVTLAESHNHSGKKKKASMGEGYSMDVIKAAKMYMADSSCTYEMAAEKYGCSAEEVKKAAADLEKKEAVETITCPDCGEEYQKGTKHVCKEIETEGKMDPVGQEDGDVDNDGDEDESDKYLKMRRKAINKALTKKKSKED